ncbi:MAG: phosphoglycerate mutase family protein [Bacteroides sp.]|nr:phosphoglycerate mutase family protein [Bacteroides sp.]
MDILQLSRLREQTAHHILSDTRAISLWEGIGGEVHIVGSLRTGLLMHRDIDLHIYTDEVSVAESFSVIRSLACGSGWKEVYYKNLMDTEEECLEWHALYQDKDAEVWKFDMIHIRKGSRYDGVVERVTEAIRRRLTPELRRTILQIKSDMPVEGDKIPGIEVYHAVFEGGVRSYDELLLWREKNPLIHSLEWMP